MPGNSTKRRKVDIVTDQDLAVQKAADGESFFLTGPAGSGKSYTVERIVKVLRDRSVVIDVLASTGIAAQNIGGQTLHSWAAIGIGEGPVRALINHAKKYGMWNKVDAIIIDEIGMISCFLLDKLDAIARTIRDNILPFGGLQVIVVGDMLQLPPIPPRPVERSKDVIVDANDEKMLTSADMWVFKSDSWRTVFRDNYVVLRKIHRQSEPRFLKMLAALRIGKVTGTLLERKRRSVEQIMREGQELEEPLVLHTHIRAVDEINAKRLEGLETPGTEYHAADTVNGVPTAQASTYLEKMDRHSRAPKSLKLRIGAPVLCIVNIRDLGICNGSRGRVVGFTKTSSPMPIVLYDGHSEPTVMPFAKFESTIKRRGAQNKIVKINLCRKQIPLLLGWAINIHRSQGMTLQCVVVMCKRAWEAGQIYVACSRCASLNRLYLVEFDEKRVKTCPVARKFYESLE